MFNSICTHLKLSKIHENKSMLLYELNHAVSDRGRVMVTVEPVFPPISICSLLDGGKNQMRCASHFTMGQSGW